MYKIRVSVWNLVYVIYAGYVLDLYISYILCCFYLFAENEEQDNFKEFIPRTMFY